MSEECPGENIQGNVLELRGHHSTLNVGKMPKGSELIGMCAIDTVT